MYLRKYRRKNHTYWGLVECERSARGPRQRIVSYLGDLDDRTRAGVEVLAQDRPRCVQHALFEEDLIPDWQEIDTGKVSVENAREFGDWWVGLWLMQKLELADKFKDLIPGGRERIPWWSMAITSVLCRLCEPSSELKVAEAIYERSPLADLLGIPVGRVNDDRLYRTLDKLLPHKEALEIHLRKRIGLLFDVEYDLLLYDVTSTFFEGACARNEQAQRGYSRDHRPDCKQVNIALVVTRCGLPLGYEVFAGNTHDSQTVKHIVETMEKRHGKADRVWVMDRGMASEENLDFLKQGGRRYILGTPKPQLRKFEKQLLEDDWTTVRDGVEAKVCPAPGGDEVFILCRSAERRNKDRAIHALFETRLESGLEALKKSCQDRKRKPVEVAKQLGRLLGKNSHASRLFSATVTTRDNGSADVSWTKQQAWSDWAAAADGCYLLRTNITDWTPEALWHTYIQLTQAEAAFHINKSDLSLRPVWHHLERRVQAHILTCFLAYVLWKTLGQMCKAAGLGDEPRKVLDELRQIRVVDVVMKTKTGIPIRRRCVTRPNRDQAIFLRRLGIELPSQLKVTEM
jgi:transposase